MIITEYADSPPQQEVATVTPLLTMQPEQAFTGRLFFGAFPFLCSVQALKLWSAFTLKKRTSILFFVIISLLQYQVKNLFSLWHIV